MSLTIRDYHKNIKRIKEILGCGYLIGKANAKTPKGEKFGYRTGIMYLAGAYPIEGCNVCPYKTKGCGGSMCLGSSGRMHMDNASQARLKRTLFFRDHRDLFFELVIHEIKEVVKQSAKKSLIPAIRLNGMSDLNWLVLKYQGKTILEHFPEVQFYDYTKNPNYDFKNLPSNYDLTFSLAENNQAKALELLAQGVNVAVVFRNKILPETYLGYKVINGDKTDLRFLDEKGVIVGLYAKGKATKDTTGFVIDA